MDEYASFVLRTVLEELLMNEKLWSCKMATYECSVCGMAVNATCAKCDEPLVNDMLTLDNGNEVQISKCPNDHGKIKSPLCCGQDMACTA